MDHDGSGRFAQGNRAGAAKRFQKGNTAGSATRFGAPERAEGLDVWERGEFDKALARHFLKHGPEALNQVRKHRPVDYLKFCIQLMPKRPPGDVDALRLLDEEIAGAPDGELLLVFRQLRERARGELAGMTEQQASETISKAWDAYNADQSRAGPTLPG